MGHNRVFLLLKLLPDLFGLAVELDLAVSKPGDGDGFDGTELFCGAGDACGFAPLFAYSEPVRVAETTKKTN